MLNTRQSQDLKPGLFGWKGAILPLRQSHHKGINKNILISFRFIMFSWPGTMALLGVTCNFIAISIIFFFAYSAFTPEPFCEESDTEDNVEDISNVIDESQSQPVIGRQNSSEESLRRRSTSQAPTIVSNGRCKPFGSKHRSYKVKKTPHSAPLPPHDYDCSEGLLRSATFPPYRWDCKGECDKPRDCKQDAPFWTTPVHQTHSSTNRSSSLSSGDGRVVGAADYEPITCAAGKNDRVTNSAEFHKGEVCLEQARTNANRLTTVTNCCHRERCTTCHTNCALSKHSEIVENGSVFCDGHRDFNIDKRHEPLDARHIRRLADGECACEYRPSYYGTSFCSRKLSQSSSSSEEHVDIGEPSIPCTKVAQCTICAAGHTDGGDYATLICNCRATKVHASERPFKGRVPDGAPAQEEPAIPQVFANINGKETGSSEMDGVQNVMSGDRHSTDTKNESLSKAKSRETSIVEQGHVNCDLAQERKLKRRSVDKTRASFKLSLKKMISRK